MKRKVHRAFIEIDQELSLDEETYRAGCLVTFIRGFGANPSFGNDVIARAVDYLDDECDGRHVL